LEVLRPWSCCAISRPSCHFISSILCVATITKQGFHRSGQRNLVSLGFQKFELLFLRQAFDSEIFTPFFVVLHPSSSFLALSVLLQWEEWMASVVVELAEGCNLFLA
jgi:hypothetical protein